MDWLKQAIQNLPGPDTQAAEAAAARQAELTKPAGSLGRLEELACWLAAWQGKHPPTLTTPHALVFVGNHGVTANDVSAYPPEVTAQMVANFKAGGAAINALCRNIGAELSVIPITLDRPTADFTASAAMTEAEVAEAISVGRDAVPGNADILLLGEMGIGNTTAAAALARSLFGGNSEDWVGPGTGVDSAGIARKRKAVEAASRYHGEDLSVPLEALRRVGGRELAAIAGACLEARIKGIPVLLDGFVSSVSAAVLQAIEPSALDHCQISHLSAEPGHRRLVRALAISPLLDLNMRLGEASGAAVAFSILHAAVAAHTGMATFAEAGISGATP